MEVSDQELFDAATSNEPTQEAPVERSEAVTPHPERDEAGRFAPKAGDVEQPPAGEEQAQPGSDPKEPPPHRFREVSERARVAEARAAELERLLLQRAQPEAAKTEPAQKPDIWDSPDQWGQGLVDPIKQELTESLFKTREFYSRKEAVREHGAEKVNEAVSTFRKLVDQDTANGPAAMQAIKESLDPIGEILVWHEQFQERQDPELARKRSVERMLADPAQRELVAQMLGAAAPAPQPTAGRQPTGTIVKLPPNLNRMTSAASDAAGGGEVSDQELFHATTSRRR